MVRTTGAAEPVVAQASRPPDQRQKHVSYGQAALEDACKRILDAPDGFQELTINRETFSLGGLIAIGELTQKEAETELYATASRVVSYDPSWPWAPGEASAKWAVPWQPARGIRGNGTMDDADSYDCTDDPEARPRPKPMVTILMLCLDTWSTTAAKKSGYRFLRTNGYWSRPFVKVFSAA
jgi:hypothetical protein